MVSSTPMMVMTTSNSISVNPRPRRTLAGLPITIRYPVQSLALRQGIHIEHIVPRLRIRRWALVTAQSPRIGSRHSGIGKHRIARHPPQEKHLDLLFALNVLDAVDQDLQVRRESRVVQFPFDVTRVRRLLVRIDGFAQYPQGLMQFGLAFTLRFEPHQRHGGAREHADDGHRDHQFDECKSPRAHAADHGLMATESGCDAAFAIAAPEGAIAEICAAIALAGRAASALKRSNMRLPSPWMGSSEATMSNWAPPLLASTVGLPALAGTTSPAVALMSCRAPESNRTWPRKRLIAMSVATRTVTSNSWPTVISPGPSTVTVGCGGGPEGAAGGVAGVGAEGATGCETEGRGPTVGMPAPPPTAPSPAEAAGVPVSNPPPPANGVLRERVSVPYQNSVESEAARACVRMM